MTSCLVRPVLTLASALVLAASAFAQAPNAAQAEKGFVKFKIGDIQVTQIYDGVWEKPHDAGFIKNASVDDTKAALKAAGQTEEFVPVTFTITVVEVGGKTIMFDSGTGGQAGGPKAGLLAKENMAECALLLNTLLRAIAVMLLYLRPVLPEKTGELLAILQVTSKQEFPEALSEVSFAEQKLDTWPMLFQRMDLKAE